MNTKTDLDAVNCGNCKPFSRYCKIDTLTHLNREHPIGQNLSENPTPNKPFPMQYNVKGYKEQN